MLNKTQRFLLFTIALASLILAPACGHAYRTGDDYPIEYRVPDKDTLVECWNFYNRECTSFAAWCLNSRNGIEFSNQYNIRADGSAGGYAQWGNAANWGYQAEALGYTVDRNPAVGSIYWSASGTWGHVAWVSKVEGTHVWAEDYNFNYAGEFRAFDFDLTDPSCAGIRFIHIADISTPVLTDYAQPSEGSYFLRSAAVEDRREGYLSADGNENYWGANVGVSSYDEQKRLRLSVVQTDNVMNGYMIFPSYSDFAIGADGRIVNANGRRAFHTANTALYGNDAYYWYFQGHWFSASKWLFEKVGYYYAIRNKNNPNLVLAVDGNNVYLQAYNGSASQLWELLPGDEDPTRPVFFGINYYLNSGKQYDNQLDSIGEQIASEKRARFSDYVIRTEIPTLPGRTFLGWSTDENATEGDPRYAPGSLYTEDKPLNLWAVWQSGTSSSGSFVFGHWEQDGDTSNGAEPLHWRILYEEGGFKYAICDSIIEIRAFGGGLQNWERSNLRSWLNGEFYQTAFNDSEKAKIVKRDQLNLGNDFWVASDDRGTADFVFLPSQKEVLQLLPNKNDRRASPSAYARDNAKLGNDGEFVSWWLRTNGIFIGQAMTVEPNGDINADGQYGGDKAGVRPVIWVSGAKNGSDPGGGGGGTVWDVADVPTNAASPMPTLTPVPTNYQPPIADSYATPTPPSSSAGNIAAFPQTAYTNMEKVNVRNAANGEKITRIEERGTAITVLGETADTNGTHWYSVRLSNGVEGYIRADLVSFRFDPSWKTTPAPVVSSSPFSSYLAKTTTKKVNVRTRADGESKTVTQIKDAGTVVTVIGEEYSANRVLWYAVVLADGRNGYIRGDLLERVNGDASATIRSLMDKDHGDFRTYDVAFFRSRDYDAHSGPGTQYLRGANGNAYMSTNDSVYVYGRENNWILVQYSISTDHWRFAYIRDDAVASGSIPALSFEYRQATAAQQSIITDDPLHSQSALTTVNAGESILYLACLDQWAYVEYKNVRGFIPSSAINQQIVSTSTPVSPTVSPSVSDVLMVNQPQIANYATDNTTGIDYINNEIRGIHRRCGLSHIQWEPTR